MDIRVLIKEMSNASSPEERERVKSEITKQFSVLSEQEKELVRKEFLKSCDEKIEETKIFMEDFDLRLEMLEISQFISLAQVAKKYFGKSKAWLYQRLYNLKVNGKPAQFTPEERNTLAEALRDIARMAQETSFKIA